MKKLLTVVFVLAAWTANATMIFDFEDGGPLVCSGTRTSITCTDSDKWQDLGGNFNYSAVNGDFTHSVRTYLNVAPYYDEPTAGPDYQWMEIDDSRGAAGTAGSLHVRATGNAGTVEKKGDEVNYPTRTEKNVGGNYYFDFDPTGQHWTEFSGKDRISFYIYVPSNWMLYNTYGYPNDYNMHVGTYACSSDDDPCIDRDGCAPYSYGEPCNGDSSHFYHYVVLGQWGGGGWSRVLLDQHPQWERQSNWSNEDNPTQATFGEDYIPSMTRIYFDATDSDSLLAVPQPIDIFLDQFEVLSSSTDFAESDQNTNTISTVVVGYYPDYDGHWEIHWQNGGGYTTLRTYEVKYSLTEFTNENYATNGSYITPLWRKASGVTGGVSKSRPENYDFSHYGTYFQLDSTYEGRGTTVYFAIKDVSASGQHGSEDEVVDVDNANAPSPSYVHTTSYTVAGSSSDAIDSLAQGYWAELSNTSVRKAAPAWISHDADPYGYEGFDGLFSWSGATVDTSRHWFILHGGGHSAYPGNELYAFDLDDLQWKLIWGPSIHDDIPGGQSPPGTCYETYVTGQPASVHTYGGLVYMPSQDLLFRAGGSLWCGGGNTTDDSWTLTLGTSTKAWTHRGNMPEMYSPYSYCDYYSGNGKIYCQNYRAFNSYTYPSTWATIDYQYNNESDYLATAIDQTNGLFVMIGGGSIHVWNLSTEAYSQPSTTGTKTAQNSSNPGLVWDSTNNVLVGYPCSGAKNIYTLNTTTWVWTEVTGYGDTPPASSQAGAVYGRFNYEPSRDVFIYYNDVDQNVYVMKNPLTEEQGRPAGPTAIHVESGLNIFYNANGVTAQ